MLLRLPNFPSEIEQNCPNSFLGGFQLLNQQKYLKRSSINASTCITQNSHKETAKRDNNLLA